MDFLKGSFLNQIKSKPLSKKGQCVLERCVCLCVGGYYFVVFTHQSDKFLWFTSTCIIRHILHDYVCSMYLPYITDPCVDAYLQTLKIICQVSLINVFHILGNFTQQNKREYCFDSSLQISYFKLRLSVFLAEMSSVHDSMISKHLS